MTAVYRRRCITSTERRDAALSGRVFTVGHCSIPPCSEVVLHCTTRTVGGMESSSAGIQFQPRDGDGGTFFRSRHDCSSVGYSACHGPAFARILRSVDAAGPPAEYAGSNFRESGQRAEGPVGEYVTTICKFATPIDEKALIPL